MKISALILAMTFTTAGFAGSIKSFDECNVGLYRSNPWMNKYSVEGTRMTGTKASIKAKNLKTKKLVVISTDVDDLGIKRYDTIRLRTALETSGTSVNSCEGVYTALKVETCTVDSVTQACESFCEIEWQGEDCR